MKIYNEKTKILFPILGFTGIGILIFFLQKEIVEKIFIISPFIILWLTYINDKRKENKRFKKEKMDKQKDIQYFFEKFIEWIKGGRERSSYLENFVLKKLNKYEQYFGISILKIEELSPDEWQYYTNLINEGDFVFIYKIYVLEGKYILEYSAEYYGPDAQVYIEFIKPKTFVDDLTERRNNETKARKNMINDIIELIKNEHGFELKYQEKEK